MPLKNKHWLFICALLYQSGVILGEVYDITTVHRLDLRNHTSEEVIVPVGLNITSFGFCESKKVGKCKFFDFCESESESDYLGKCNGWTESNFGQIHLKYPLSNELPVHEVFAGGISSVVSVPSNEFVLSYRTMEPVIYVFLLVEKDVMTSNMIMLKFTNNGNSDANICQDYLESDRKSLPDGRTRKCFSTSVSYILNPSSEYTSLYIELNPLVRIENLDESDLPMNVLSDEFYHVYRNEKFIIKYVAIGTSSGVADFKLWPSFKVLRLSKSSGELELERKIRNERSLVLCLSVSYYLEPNSRSTIEVLLEDYDGTELKIGTVSPYKGEIPASNFTTRNFIMNLGRVKSGGSWEKIKIRAKRQSIMDPVLIKNITSCDLTELGTYISYNVSGITEIYAMTNARGLPIFLHNGSVIYSNTGGDIKPCTALNGCYMWTITNWTNASMDSKLKPPLQISEDTSYTEYTRNNYTTLHLFQKNTLNFMVKSSSNRPRFLVHLLTHMSSRPITDGDMYYIEGQCSLELGKCTSISSGSNRYFPGNNDRTCNVLKDFYFDCNDLRALEIKYFAGRFLISATGDSSEELLADWEDDDPLNIGYYRFGSWDELATFVVDEKASEVLSLTTEDGLMTSPPFLPSSNSLCVSLTYYLTSEDAELKLYAQWVEEDMEYLDSFMDAGEWKIQRSIYKLSPHKANKRLSIVLRGEKTAQSNIYVQLIGGCAADGSKDVIVLPTVTSFYFPNRGIDVAVHRSSVNNTFSSEIDCANGGVFISEYKGCVCPAGFSGTTCEKGCGENRFGATCDGQCSKMKNGCQGMIFCLPYLGCSCAAGIQGVFCTKQCDARLYGASCKQHCGKCRGYASCDSYSGECQSECVTGYYPPFCQHTYKYISVEPKITAVDYNSLKLRSNLKHCIGLGTPRFFQLQYREYSLKKNSWSELRPTPIISNELEGNITGLKAGTRYQVRVVLIDQDGGSYQGPEMNPSDMSTVYKSSNENGLFPEIPYADVTTMCTIPEIVDYNILLTELTDHAYKISWEFIPKSPLWCEVSQFEVQYYDDFRWVALYEGLDTETTFSNTLPGEKYEIRLRAISKVNTFPFSHVLKFTTKYGIPGRIRDIKASSTINHGTAVQWVPPHNSQSVNRYRVSYGCQKLLACKHENCSFSSGTVEVTSTSVTLHDLLSYAQYTISVAALGTSWGPAREIRYVTDMTVPGVSPNSSSTPVIKRTNSSITVQWEPPHNCTHLNGYLYEYHYILTSQNDSKQTIEGNTDHTQVEFTSLTPHSHYLLKVFVVTSGGWNLDFPLQLPVKTTATTPDAVQQLTVYKKGRRIIGIKWAEPKRIYGILKSFFVSYHAEQISNSSIRSYIKPSACIPWPNLFCHTLTGLQPDKEYTISVQTQNAEVDELGMPSTVTAITKESAPTSPTYLKTISQSQTNLTVEWGLPEILNGILRSFLINVEETDSYNSTECCQYLPVKEVAVQSEERSYQIEFVDLQPASTYTISVSAKTIAMGPATTITAYTRPPVPSMQDMIEISKHSSNGSLTALIHPSSDYESLVSGYLLLVIPESNIMNMPKTSITDVQLVHEINNNVNGSYYFTAEFDQEELLKNPEVNVGSGRDLEIGKWGETQDPLLEKGKNYRLGLIILLNYCGVYSVGYSEIEDIYIDY